MCSGQKIANIEGQINNKTLRDSIMGCLKINWLKITIQLARTTTDHPGFTTFCLKYNFCHFNSGFGLIFREWIGSHTSLASRR